MQIDNSLDPFIMQNSGFSQAQISGVPTINIKKNLNKNRGALKINPINLFNELDSIFESFFDTVGDSIIQENQTKKTNHNQNIKKIDDYINSDVIDLNLNDSENHNNPNHKHNDHEQHIKLNYVKDVEKAHNEGFRDKEQEIQEFAVKTNSGNKYKQKYQKEK